MIKRLLFTAALLLPCCFLTACSGGNPASGVTVASKQFTENVLLSEMYAQLIENNIGIKVTRRQYMGNAACFPAMEAGDVDMYVEYSGTIYKEILQNNDVLTLDSDAFHALIKQELYETKNITLYDSIGVNNTYALAMRKDVADSLGVKSMSDLSFAAPHLVFAANEGFYTRTNDGYRKMLDIYGMSFNSAAEMSTDSLYEAISKTQIDVMVAYATDSQLKEHELIILDDDKSMFPEYCAAPIIRNDTLRKYPELNNVLNLLAASIDDTRMQELNYMVDFAGKSVEEVARVFLTEQELLK